MKKGHIPTEESRKLVETLSGYGIPHKMICKLIPNCRSSDTLEKHYRDELDRGDAKACSQVAGKLYEKCMEGDTASIIFWMKTRMGWREKDREETNSVPEPKKIIFQVVDATIERTTE
jgi:hypothetical protein